MSDYWCPHCGKRFRSYAAEAKHRHNFPLLCRKPLVKDSVSAPDKRVDTADAES